MHKIETAANEREVEKQRQQGNSFFKIPIFQPTAAAAMMYNLQNVTIKQKQITDSLQNKLADVGNKDQGDYRIPATSSSTALSSLIKKDSSDTNLKLFPYVCGQCKKDIWTCDTASQTVEFLIENESDKIIYSKSNKLTIKSPQINHNRSKSNVINTNSDLNSRDILLMKTVTNVYDVNECNRNQKLTYSDSWTDLDVNSITYK